MDANIYWCWNNEVSRKICKKIIKLGKGKWHEAQTYGSDKGTDSLNNVRKSEVVWIRDQWVYDLIWGYMMTANESGGWNYNIVGAENCQVTRYPKGGYYAYHKDGLGSHLDTHNDPNNKILHGNCRKLSMSIFLNSDYEGGDFEMDEEDKIPRFEEGSIIVFPSFLKHRVTPVTKGVRYSLVSWFVGPPFI
tara:strand:- start:469 stop:1041 length:573 start_codon:yes stop_codon:yes gene_type:complete